MKHKTKRELLDIVESLSFDPIWNIYTRPALELRWDEFTKDCIGVVYCDIDKMHDLNSLYGHSGTDERIKSVIHNIRELDIIAGRWLNGDEIIFILKSGNPLLFCVRIQDEFRRVGISATFSKTEWILESAFETINPLDQKVQISKNAGQRGIIVK